MRSLFVILSFWLCCFAVESVHAADQRAIALTHATLIDATGAPAQPDMTLVITNDRISAIGRSGRIKLPADAEVIDATGKFLIPGLWDMHVHWYHSDYLPVFIVNGITGIRIMWGIP